MKNRLTNWVLILTLSILPSLVFSQDWFLSYSSSNRLNKVFTLDVNHAYAVGPGGFFVRTTNGGFTWEQVQTNTTKQLFDVQFINSMTGFICGDTGTMLKSIDGGTSWNPCTTNTTLNLRSICFINNNIGWISGSSSYSALQINADTGVILKTTNGGSTFSVSKTLNEGVQKIAAFNPDTCLAISDAYSNKTIWRTTNSGATWQSVHSGGFNVSLTSIVTFPYGVAYIPNAIQNLYSTHDFGASWDSSSLASGQVVTDMSFPSPDTGYSAGYDAMAGVGNLFVSLDGGQIWTSQFGEKPFISINFANDTCGFACTSDGYIYKHGIIDGINPQPQAIKQGFKFYPNPVTSSINFSIQSNSSIQSYFYIVDIYSVDGKKLLEYSFHGRSFKMDGLQILSSGTYSLVVSDQSSILYSTKFIKKE